MRGDYENLGSVLYRESISSQSDIRGSWWRSRIYCVIRQLSINSRNARRSRLLSIKASTIALKIEKDVKRMKKEVRWESSLGSASTGMIVKTPTCNGIGAEATAAYHIRRTTTGSSVTFLTS